MTAISIFLVITVIILCILLVLQQRRIVIANRNLYDNKRNIGKEREATTAILGLSGEVIDTDISDEAFLVRFVEYAERTIKGSGAAILKLEAGKKFRGCAVAGSFPPLKDNMTPQVEQQLLAHPKKHLEFFKEIKVPFNLDDVKKTVGDKQFAFFHNNHPEWLPVNFKKNAPRLLLAPIYIHKKISAVVMITSGDDFDMHKISEEDGQYLVRLNEIATLSMEGIRAFRERREYEEQVQTAREEGMLQVSAGIIHNIGNAITVAKLSVHELKEKMPGKKEAPETLLTEELLPTMKKKLEAGKLQEFMEKDKVGSQYIDIMTELLQHIADNKTTSIKVLDSLSEKLKHISEIIELQQHFVGELGTENMVGLRSVIDSSVKIFEETFNKHAVDIKTNYDDVPNVLIDPSMMTQVFMNLIKNAVEAMDSENDKKKKHTLDISLFQKTIDGNKFVITEVKDNGPGMNEEVKNKIFNFGFSTKSKEERTSRGYGLHSCINTITKYGGNLEVDSDAGEGTTFRILLPRGKEEE